MIRFFFFGIVIAFVGAIAIRWVRGLFHELKKVPMAA